MTEGMNHPPGHGSWSPQPVPPGGYGYPQPQEPWSPSSSPGFAVAPAEPDWAALADENEAANRRRRRLIASSGILAACVLGAAVTAAVALGSGAKSKATAESSPAAGPTNAVPSASAGASHSAAPVTGPTLPGQPGVLADHAGHADVTLSPGAGLKAVSGGSALHLAGNADSFAQSAGQVVDVTKSFTVSAWVYGDATTGTRTVLSQGDGGSFSFDLGREDSGGHRSWSFRVQTADGGADGTIAQVVSPPSNDTAHQWVLLTGTYDAGHHTIALYVNGAAAVTKQVPGVWAGPGALQFGRARSHGAWNDYWAGVIGHVQVWNRSLTSSQALAVFKNGGPGASVKPIASWLV